MSYCISKRPLITVVTSQKQEDRLDTFYYHPKFNELETKLNAIERKLITAETASKLITDGTHQTPLYIEPSDSSIPLLSSGNIKEEGIETSELKHITLEEHLSLKNSNPIVGDVLLSVAGSIGTATVFKGELAACSLLRSVAILRVKKDWDPEFIACLINSKIGKLQIERLQKGIAVKTFRLGEIKQLVFPETSTKEQELIVLRFNMVQGWKANIGIRTKVLLQKIKNNSNKEVDKVFASELGLKNFVSKKNNIVFVRNHALIERLDISANHPDYTNLVGQIKKSLYSGTLSDLVDVSEERFNPDDNRGEYVNYLAIGDIDGLSGKIISPQIMLFDELPSRARRLAFEGDILIGIAGASTGTDNMVVFPVATEQSGWVVTTGFLILRPKKGVRIDYVCSLLKSPFVLRQIRALLISPAMPTISELDLLAILVPVTNSDIRDNTLFEIENILSDSFFQITQLDDLCNQTDRMLSEVKLNIFDLLDDVKFSEISSRAEDICEALTHIEEVLQ